LTICGCYCIYYKDNDMRCRVCHKGRHHDKTGRIFVPGRFAIFKSKDFAKATEKFNAFCGKVSACGGLYWFGLCLERTGKLTEAVTMYKKASKSRPKRNGRLYLGVVYLGLNQNWKAWYQFKKTLTLQPNNSQALHNIGLIHFNLKKYKKAIHYLCAPLSCQMKNYTPFTIFWRKRSSAK